MVLQSLKSKGGTTFRNTGPCGPRKFLEIRFISIVSQSDLMLGGRRSQTYLGAADRPFASLRDVNSQRLVNASSFQQPARRSPLIDIMEIDPGLNLGPVPQPVFFFHGF